MQVWQKGFQPFPPKWSFFDHGNVPAACTCTVQSSTPFFCLIDRVAVKSAGSNPAKTGPGRGVQHNTHFPYKTLVTLNGGKNSIPSQLYSSTSCKCLPNWPDSPCSHITERSGYEYSKSLFVNSLNRPQMKVMYEYSIRKPWKNGVF